MECKTASMLMMKYMDSIILEIEAVDLDAHLMSCPCCKEDFAIYEKMMRDFSCDTHLFEPPPDFEACVMQKIAVICPAYNKIHANDTLISLACGASSMLVGAGIIAYMYSEQIMSYAEKYAFVSMIKDGAVVIADRAVVFASNFSDGLFLYLNGLNQLIYTWKYGILGLVFILVAVQLLLYSNNKVEA